MAIQGFFTADRAGKGLRRRFLLPFHNRLPVFVNNIVDRLARGRRYTGLVIADKECFFVLREKCFTRFPVLQRGHFSIM